MRLEDQGPIRNPHPQNRQVRNLVGSLRHPPFAELAAQLANVGKCDGPLDEKHYSPLSIGNCGLIRDIFQRFCPSSAREVRASASGGGLGLGG